MSAKWKKGDRVRVLTQSHPNTMGRTAADEPILANLHGTIDTVHETDLEPEPAAYTLTTDGGAILAVVESELTEPDPEEHRA